MKKLIEERRKDEKILVEIFNKHNRNIAKKTSGIAPNKYRKTVGPKTGRKSNS